MAITIFPAPSTEINTVNGNALTAVSPNTNYQFKSNLLAGVYTISCASTTVTTADFMSSSGGLIASGSTTSGTVNINVASNADRVIVRTDTGTNIAISITRISNTVSDTYSGTLDTITTSGTYTGTSTSGLGYALVVGGGGNGGAGAGGNQGASGAGGGGTSGKLIQLTGSMAVTVGTAGGASTFAGMTANGGASTAKGATTGGAGGTASGGTINLTGNNGNNYSGQNGGAGGAANSAYPFIKTNAALGTGGIPQAYASPTPATGYGAGGAGGFAFDYPGGAGTPGVVYVVRIS